MPPMKIGQIVQQALPAIFEHCEGKAPEELSRLQDRAWSKETFDINFPFCRRVDRIGEDEHVRYWRRVWTVRGVSVRVTSQWFNPPTSRSLPLFRAYLARHRLTGLDRPGTTPPESPASQAAKGRYKGNAIGNAQNALVRNILSRLGDEQFGAADWQAVVEWFGAVCAYCGRSGPLVMDHVVPINRQALGEHRLGNLVPACRDCNTRKGDRALGDFLARDPVRRAAIEAHMARHGYRPPGDDPELRRIVEMAHRDVRQLSDRYVEIIDALRAAPGTIPRPDPGGQVPTPPATASACRTGRAGCRGRR